MTLSRRTFLCSAAAGLAASAVPKVSRAAGDERYLLIVFAQGGWDVNYALDPKQAPACDVPAGEITTFPGDLRIRTGKARPSVRAFFDAHARRSAVVNGIWVGSVAHVAARVRMLTGTRTRRSPDLAAIFAASAAEARPSLALPYVDLGGGAFAGPLASVMGRVGATNQLVALLGQRQRQVALGGLLFDRQRLQRQVAQWQPRACRAQRECPQPGPAGRRSRLQHKQHLKQRRAARVALGL